MQKRLTLSFVLMAALASVGCSQTRQPAVGALSPPPIGDVESVNAVTGSFTVGPIFSHDKSPSTVQLTQAYARLVKNRKDETKQDVVILLTEKPLARRAISAVEATNAETGADHLRAMLEKRAVRGIQLRLAVDRKAAAEVKEKIERRQSETGIFSVGDPNDIDAGKRGDSLRMYYDGGQIIFTYQLEINSFSTDTVQGHLKAPDNTDVNFTVKLRPNDWTGGVFYRQPPTGLEPGRASGQIEIDGKSIKLNYVYALHERGNNNIKVWFTEQPVEVSALGGDDVAKNSLAMKRGGNGVVLLYYANPVSDPRWSQIWRVDRDLRQSIEDTESDYVKFDDRVIEGRLYTVRPYKLFDDTYRIEVLFNAAIVQP